MISEVATFVNVIKLTEIALGILLNSFIVMVNVIWWWRSRTVQTIDLIVSTMGLIRLLHLVVSGLTVCPHFLKSLLQNRDRVHKPFLMAQTCMSNYGLWTGTFLCLFYCVKITSYNHKLFMYLKLNISRLIPGFLVASLAISILNVLPIEWFVYQKMNISSSNISALTPSWRITTEINAMNLFVVCIAGMVVPLLIFCPSIYLLISSLWSHHRHMKSADCGFSRRQLDAHVNAVRNMLSFLVLYLAFFGASSLLPVCLKSGRKTLIELCLIFVFAYPSVHSVILIWSHRRMNRLLRGVVQWAMGRQIGLSAESETNTF